MSTSPGKANDLVLIALAKSELGLGFNDLYYNILSGKGSKSTLSKHLKDTERLGIVEYDPHSRRWRVRERVRRHLSRPYELVEKVMDYFVNRNLFSGREDAVKAAIEFWYTYYGMVTSKDTLAILSYHYESQRFFSARVTQDQSIEEKNQAERFIQTTRRITHLMEDELFEILWNFCRKQDEELVQKILSDVRSSERNEYAKRVQEIVNQDSASGLDIHITDRVDELTATARLILKERYPQAYHRFNLEDFIKNMMASIERMPSKMGS